MASFIAWVLSIGFPILLLVGFYRKFRFEPLQNKLYILSFLNNHLFTIHVGNMLVEWFQRFPLYLIFWPFRIVVFGYSWTKEYTYAEAMEKIKEENAKEGRKAELYWIPKLKETDYDDAGHPKNKNLKVLIKRTEQMIFLNELEKWIFAAEFETSDNYRGWRKFIFTFKITNLSNTVSITQEGTWQEIATKLFSAKYLAFSKKQDYEQLRTFEMKHFTEAFMNEVNKIIEERELGFEVNIIAPGDIVLHPDTQDLLDSLELEEKALNQQKATVVETATMLIKTDGEVTANIRVATGEATVIRIKSTANADAIQKVLEPIREHVKETTPYIKGQNASIYGLGGLAAVKGTIIMPNNGNNQTGGVDISKITEQVIGTVIGIESKNKKGGDDAK